jgi:glutaredoxin
MEPSRIRLFVGRGLKPILTSERLDHVKYLRPLRTTARDFAVAFGFWDDGVLEKEVDLRPIHTGDSARDTRARVASSSSLTLYVDREEATTLRMRTFLGDHGIVAREIDIADDESSRKWLAETFDGARPPQLFADGQRVGGLAELQKLAAEGQLARRLGGKAAGGRA